MSSAAENAKNITITLPDGSTRSYEAGVTGLEVAESIGAGLAKAAVAVKVDGEQRDLYLPINDDANLAILTTRDDEGLEIMRHTTTAQVLALAIKELWPAAKLAIGPTITDGFYYDIDLDESLSIEDFPKIEAKMKEITERKLPVRREMWKKEDAIAYFEGRGESYKVDIISRADSEEISLYRQGEGDNDTAYIDLCFGPHAPSLSHVSQSFKLTKLAGAYWRGDSKNKMLQRIYGTCWADKKALKAYLLRIEEAEKRDHRKLGKEMELFHIQEEAVGQVFWHNGGWELYRELENYIRRKLQAENYQEVKTPVLVDRKLWEESGHWDKFRENMFTSESEDKTLAIKPMNCPCHVQIFNQGIKSYRDLPLRMAEFGSCHRNEPSGALHGLMRVRGFTQDDAHIFCTEDQITSETVAFCELLKAVYKDLGFEQVKVKFSDRPETRAGSDAIWDKAESSLKEAVEVAGLDYTLNPGEGAFYGPKIEFVLTDAIGRDWQCGTLQVDFVLPERLDANYVAADGHKKRPVMLHRAILGSFERFIGILIEQYAGKFPLWLAPIQVLVATITNDTDDYADDVVAELKAKGIRAEVDKGSDKISYKVRQHSLRKIPVILALGGREAEEKTVSVRRLGSKQQEVLALDAFISNIVEEANPPA